MTLLAFIKNRKAWVLIVAWVIAALACNFPMLPREEPPSSEGQVYLTLEAGLRATAQHLVTTPGAISTKAPPLQSELATPDPGSHPEYASSPLLPQIFEGLVLYPAQSGDTLPAVARRFGVEVEQIASPDPLPVEGLIPAGQLLVIPNVSENAVLSPMLLPDSELIYSPSVAGFSVSDFVLSSGGFLASYREKVDEEWLSGIEIFERVALDYSVNPRLLLAILEYRSNWVYGQPADTFTRDFPFGLNVPGNRGLYKELSIVARHLNIGYYGWRSGSLTQLTFPDSSVAGIDPALNAGTVALQSLFSKLYRPDRYRAALFEPGDFLVLHQRMFGDPWERAAFAEPIFPPGLSQPLMELPFSHGERWSFTGGPHYAWGIGTPRGALDFGPVTGEPPCAVSKAWVRSSAPGVVVRSERSMVTVDLDGDGFEGTGWVMFYFHIAERDRVPAGVRLNLDDPIGHPSCEGGNSTGTHVHIARKYNGEWIPAAEPLPFVLSGWVVKEGSRAFEGMLTNGEHTVIANPGGSQISIIIR